MSSSSAQENFQRGFEDMNVIESSIRIIKDHPKPGINFYDIATLLDHPPAWSEAIRQMRALIEPLNVDKLMGIESRGFLVASALAHDMQCGFGMIRKKGKLPGDVISESYALEYGEDTIEVQPDLIENGARIAIVDDLLATGGTMAAAEKLVEKAGGNVIGNFCIIELDGLKGREKLSKPFKALLNCPT